MPEAKRPGEKRLLGSNADLRRRRRARSERVGPQMFIERLSCVGHHGRVAEAFSLAQREKTAVAVSVRRWSEAGSADDGRRAE